MIDIAPYLFRKLAVDEDHDMVYLKLFGKPDVRHYHGAQRDQDARIR